VGYAALQPKRPFPGEGSPTGDGPILSCCLPPKSCSNAPVSDVMARENSRYEQRSGRDRRRGDAHLTIRAMLCAPFRTGTAHIMQLGSVGVNRRGHQSLQPPCGRVAPRQMSGKQHIHDIGIRSCPVRHRTHSVPDCEARPPKNLDGFASRAGCIGGSPRHFTSGDGPARVLVISRQCFAEMRRF
jgi:hypothetical protein